jgi:hypothetical protein
LAKIKISAKYELYDGMAFTFKAPCDSTAANGLKVCAANVTQTFTFRDAHGNDLANQGNLFSAGAYVKVILDTVRSYAYLLNTDTNKYLENRFKDLPKVSVDTTLSIEGAAADAKAVGEALSDLSKQPLINLDTSLSVKGAAADAKAVGDALLRLDQRASVTDFSDWADGSFSVQMSDGSVKAGTVTFDGNSRPTSITLAGHTLTLTLPEGE